MMQCTDFMMLVFCVWLAQARIWGNIFFDEFIFFDGKLNFFLMTFIFFLIADSFFIESVTPPGPQKCVMFVFFWICLFFSTSLIYLFIHPLFLLLRFGGFYKQELKYSLVALQGMQAVVVAKVISKVKASQDYSGFVPGFSNVNQYMNHRSHKWITNMWGQILMALPSLIMMC